MNECLWIGGLKNRKRQGAAAVQGAGAILKVVRLGIILVILAVFMSCDAYCQKQEDATKFLRAAVAIADVQDRASSLTIEEEEPDEEVRVFAVERDWFLTELKRRGNPAWTRNEDGSTPDLAESVRRALFEKGFKTNAHEVVIFESRSCSFISAASHEQMVIIESFFKEYALPPQINIEVTIAELEEEKGKSSRWEEMLNSHGISIVTNASGFYCRATRIEGMGTDAIKERVRGDAEFSPPRLAVMSERQYRTFTSIFGQDPKVVRAPSLTTLSGRLNEIKIVEIMALPGKSDLATNSSTRIELGSTINTTAVVLKDRLTISLTAIAQMTDFVTYKLEPSADSAGSLVPVLREREAEAELKVCDGQTLVLDAGVTSLEQFGGITKSGKVEYKRLLFFITPTIIDGTGKRINAEQREGIPPQP
jgi:hypothetical protein